MRILKSQKYISRRIAFRNKWDAEFLGTFFGRFQALEKLYGGEDPLCPESQAEMDAVKAKIKTQPTPKNLKTIEKDVETKFKATNEAIMMTTAAAVEMPYEEGQKFHEGLARGMKIEPDELTAGRMFQRHTRTYLVLVKSWRAVMNCRSLKHLHTIFCDAVGEKRIGNFKAFEKVCQKIGLTIGNEVGLPNRNNQKIYRVHLRGY